MVTNWKEWCVFGAIAAVAGWLTSSYFGWRSASEGKHWWDIATAIGTVGSTVVVGCFGLRDGWRLRRHADQRAHVAAAKVSVFLTESLRELSTLSALLDFYDDIRDGNGPEFQKLQGCVERSLCNVDASDLLDLVPLPSHCAARISRGKALLELVQRDMATAAWLFDRPDLGESRCALAKKWSSMVYDADGLLSVANRGCLHAAQLGAPVPDGQERYDGN